MIRLLLWLAVCGALAVLLRRRPAALGAAVVLLWTSVPASAGSVFTGVGGGSNLPQMHPAAWLALAGGLVSPYWLRRDRGLPLLTVLALVLQTTAIVLVVLSTVIHQGVPSVFRVCSSLVAPGVLFLLLTSAFRSDARSARRLQALVVAIAVVQAGLGVVQYFLQEQIVYANFRASAWWYNPDLHVRGIGTADSPLDLSLLLLFSIPLVRVLPSTLLRLTTTGVLLAGLLATESRTATALGVLVAVLVVSTDSRAGLWRWAALGTLGAGGLWAAGSALGAGLSDRISDDSNSTTARLESYSYFAEHWTDFLTSGEGWGYASGLRSAGVLVTSPENAYMMLAYDGGLVCALALVAAQVMHLCAGVRTGWVTVLPGLLATVMAFSYSSFANSTASGALVWLAMAFSAAGAAEGSRRRAVRPSTGHGAAVWSLPPDGGLPAPPRSAVVAGA